MDQSQVHAVIKKNIEDHRILLFMKGTPSEPMCGFSAQVVKILGAYDAPFHSINVLADWDIREGIKSYSNWPTIPQLYINGQFVGGCDIVSELHRKNQLAELINAQA